MPVRLNRSVYADPGQQCGSVANQSIVMLVPIQTNCGALNCSSDEDNMT